MARILVIDDEAELRQIICNTLKLGGHEVIEARNGREGVDRYSDATVDLVITDIMMPESDGFETIIALRRGHPDVKIVAISGGGRVGDTNYLMLAERLGADRILAKPFQREQLLAAVRDCLAAAA